MTSQQQLRGKTSLVLGVALGYLLIACSSPEWENKKRPDANYAADYQLCKSKATHDPHVQAEKVGMASQRCLRENEWYRPYRDKSIGWRDLLPPEWGQ